MRALARAALLALAAAAAPALAAPPVPPLEGRVNDRAGVLPADRRAALEAELARFEAQTSHQIVVLTVPSLEGDPIEDYSMRVAEQWRIGHAKLDNGILLVVAPADRKVRIEVGYGLEGVVPDAVAARILREHVIPEFQAGRIAEGIEAGVQVLMRAARQERLPPPPRPRGGGESGAYRRVDPLSMLLFTAFGASALGFPFRRSRSGARVLGSLIGAALAGGLTWLLLASLPWAALAALIGGLCAAMEVPLGGLGRGGVFPSSMGRGGFGGGGFGGGGGRFGGGGASGSW